MNALAAAVVALGVTAGPGWAEPASGQPSAGQPAAVAGQSAAPQPLAGQPPPGPDTPVQAAAEPPRTAEELRSELGAVLRQYPPALREVLRLSPSLATNADYLQAYPALAAFLAAHPETVQNAAFYFGTPYVRRDLTPAAQRTESVSGMLAGTMVFLGLMSLLGVLGWLLKALLDHQRWKRALRVQADAHAKLLERLSSTDDVLAYSQTPAGRQFLESGSPADAARPALGMPVGRIFWSVQIGTVVAFLGIGIFVCATLVRRDPDLTEVASFLTLVGIVALSAGIGFLLSALASYFLSRRLGLLGSPESQHG